MANALYQEFDRLQTALAEWDRQIKVYQDDAVVQKAHVEHLEKQVAALKHDLEGAVLSLKSFEEHHDAEVRDYEEQIEGLKEQVHKGQGMANEINILVKEVAALKVEVEAAKEVIEVLIPMAKGYAFEHQVGNNQKIVSEIEASLQAGKEGEDER